MYTLPCGSLGRVAARKSLGNRRAGAGTATRNRQICGWNKGLAASSGVTGRASLGRAVITFMMTCKESKGSQPTYLLDRVKFENAHKIRGCPKDLSPGFDPISKKRRVPTSGARRWM